MNNSEKEFQKYLNKHNIPFWFIDQETATFSKAIKKMGGKRPDFFVFVPNFGFMLVDVKDKEPLVKHKKICLDFDETRRYCKFQEVFGIPIWFVVACESMHYSTWYCIPVTKVKELKGFLINRKYYSVPVEKYSQLSTNSPFYELIGLFNKNLLLKN